MTVVKAVIEKTPSFEHACELFLDDLGAWITDCIGKYQDAPVTDIHDQATFTSSWGVWIRQRNDDRALTFMLNLARNIQLHFQQSQQWHHGYWARQEVHHGTEHFELFLGHLFDLKPKEDLVNGQLLDACEHIGNWVENVPQWFDWERSMFVSTHLGTREIGKAPGYDMNIPDHLRMINLCLMADRASSDQRYLDLAIAHCARWAEAINSARQLPLALTKDGWIEEFSEAQRAAYNSIIEQLSAFKTPVDRAESFLASNGVNTLLTIWCNTSEPMFRQAAEKLLDVLSTQLGDADAGAVADVIRRYRRMTGDGRYDEAVLQAVDALDPFGFQTLSLEPDVEWGRRPPGIGKRKDMAKWYEDDRDRRHNPVLLSLAAEIRSDSALAQRSLELGRTYFNLARQTYPDGREHGCSGRSVSAIARGHGRDNNTGVITAVLEPLLSDKVYAELI